MATKKLVRTRKDLVPVRVRVIDRGIYAGRIREVGDVFDIESYRLKWEDVEVEDADGSTKTVRRIKSKWLELVDGPSALPPTEQPRKFAHLAREALASAHGLQPGQRR